MQEFVDCRGVAAREMLVDLMGMGKQPDEITVEITVDSPMFRAISAQYEQSIAAPADVVGLRIDEIRSSICTATSLPDNELSCAMLPSGSVVGQILSWTAYQTALRYSSPRSTGG